MYFTYVVRPGEAPEGRGPQLQPLWNSLVYYNLRLGLLVQLVAFIGLLLTISGGGNDALTILDFLRASPDAVGNSRVWAVQLFCGLFAVGCLNIMAFQQLVDDDSRGFSWILTLLVFWAANYYFDDPWMQKQLGSGSTWLTYFTARLCDALNLSFTGAAIFFSKSITLKELEKAGAGFVLFVITPQRLPVLGLMAFGTEAFKVLDSTFSVLLGIALVLGFIWALIFEPISHRFDVKLTQSAMRNEYYKSRNAMAYYGPAVVNADGEIDIAAAAEQAQACLSC